MVLSVVTEVEAASKYKKKFTKTVDLGMEGEEKELTFTLKKKGTYTITVSNDVKPNEEYGNCNITVWTGKITKEVRGETVKDNTKHGISAGYCETTEGNNKTTLTIKSDGKGEQKITFSGWGDGFKVTVSAKKAVLKYKSLKKYELPEDVG